MFPEFITAIVEVRLDHLQQFVEIGTIPRIDLCQSDASAGLSPDKETQTGLALHYAVGDAHFTTQRRQEKNQLKQDKLLLETIVR